MNENMNQYLEKAKVLIEALPYIQRFNRKIIVVKYGGSAMNRRGIKAESNRGRYLIKTGGLQTDHCARRRKRNQ